MALNLKMADFYKIEEKILMFHGIWPYFGNKYMTFLHFIQKWITYLLSGSFLLSLGIDIIFNANSMVEITDSSYYFVTQLTYILKLICLRWKYGQFKDLVLGDHGLQEGGIQTTFPWLKYSTFITKKFLLICYVTSIFYCIRPFFDDTLLPLGGGWFPWSIEESILGRTGAYLFQFVGIFLGVNVNAEMDTLVVSLILASCWQIRLLKDNLSRISKNQDHVKITSQMINSLKHHSAIIEYVAKVEDIFGRGLFFQFLTSGCTMCITGFQIMVTPFGTAKFLTLLSYLFAITFQISIYCWAGQQLITESTSIIYGCYAMDWWYEKCPKDARTALFLIMERSKKPISIRAGRFFTLSIDTLATIVRTSYSVFAVMRKIQINDTNIY